jgi:hypothetical protein
VNRQTKAFLEQVREAEDPSAETEQRVLRAVHATVALAAATGATASAARAEKLGTVSTATLLKAGALCLVLAGASMALVPWRKVESTRLPKSRAPVIAPRLEVGTDASVSRESKMDSAIQLAESVRAPTQESPPPSSAPLEARVRSQSGVAARVLPGPDLRDELTFLAEVRALLQRGEGTIALRKLDEHVTADRQLLSERQVARVLALCAVGKTREAQLAAAAFLRRHPSSPHSAAIASTCVARK